MAKITPLQQKIRELPKGIGMRKNVLPALRKHDISSGTFYRDLKSDGNSIPYARLQIYAGFLGCSVDDLINSYTRVKPLVKPARKKVSLLSKAGVK